MRRTGFKNRGKGFKKKIGKPMKKSRLRKKSPQKISTLKRKLWAIFSKWIRQRDSNICFTCGKKIEGGLSQAGHFIPRSVGGLTLYFNEDNVHCQCSYCNLTMQGNIYEYGKRLGEKMVFYLQAMKHKTIKLSAEDYLEKIKHYQELLK